MKNGIVRYGIYLSALLVFLVAIAFFTPKILATTNTVKFCAKCHVMQEQYVSLMQGGLHNSLKCVDCHLPNDSKVKFYFWKAVDGGKDIVFFHTGNFPERIKASEHTKNTIQTNCIKCHEGMVSRLTVADRKCWDCHKRVSHRQTGFRETM